VSSAILRVVPRSSRMSKRSLRLEFPAGKVDHSKRTNVGHLLS